VLSFVLTSEGIQGYWVPAPKFLEAPEGSATRRYKSTITWTIRRSKMKIECKKHLRKRELACAVLAVLGALAGAPAYSADAEVDALKAELAAQRKLIEQLLSNQQKQATTAATVPATNVAAPASPTTLKIYGVADVGVTSTDSGFGRKTRIEGGGGFSASRLGLQINRDFGNGMSAVAVAEGGVFFSNGSVGAAAPAAGLNATAISSSGATGTGPQIFARQIFAGLSGNFGQVTIGRQYTGSYVGAAAVGAAKGDGLYANNGTITPLVGGMPTRVNNSILWKTPKVGNVTGWLTYFAGSENNVAGPTAVGATTTTDKAGAGYDLAAIYAAGPLVALASVWDLNNNSWVTAGETDLAKKKGYQLAANYNFRVVKLYGSFVHGTISGGNYENVTKSLSSGSAYGLGIEVPLGKHTVVARYTSIDDKSALNRDGKLYGVAWWYPLFKDTNVYAAWGKQKNNANASYALSDAGNLVGNLSKPGYSPSGFQFGVNVTF